MNNKKEILDGGETTIVIKSVYDAIKKYENIKGLDIRFEDLNIDGTPSIGLFTMPGAIYTKKYITGGFEALLPFSIVYRENINEDKYKFELIDRLNQLGIWISIKENFPVLSDGRIVEKIEQTSVPYRNTIDPGCENDYIVTFQMIYRKDV